MNSGADISGCGQYRYRLWRWWDESRDLLGFIMLNPSTADASRDDPTIRKCRGFAERLGYGGIMVTNLFAFRATSPADMKAATDPVGPDNDVFLRTEAAACRETVCAWGTHGAFQGRDQALLSILVGAPLRALRLTKAGHPGHPLYIPYGTPLVTYRNADLTDEWVK